MPDAPAAAAAIASASASVSGERLLAGDVLAGLEGGDRLLGMDVVRAWRCRRGRRRRTVTAARQSVVVVLPTPAVGELGELGRVAADHGVHRRQRIDVEELADVEPGVGMGAAHELRTEQRDVDVCSSWHLLVRRVGASTPRYRRCSSGSASSSVGGGLGLDPARHHHELSDRPCASRRGGSARRRARRLPRRRGGARPRSGCRRSWARAPPTARPSSPANR